MATQSGRHKQGSWIRRIIIVIAVLLFASSAVTWILQGIIFGHLSTVVSITFAVTGIIVSLIQWLFPYSSSGIHNDAMMEIKNGNRTALEEPKDLPALSTEGVDRETSAIKPIWNVPFRRNPFFTGREAILAHLRDVLTSNKTAALTQPQAISGLGGIGKTQTAVEYTYRYRNEYRYVFWVRADTIEVLVSELATLGNLLNLQEKNAQDQSIMVKAVKHWLQTHTDWLLILDNAEDLSMAYDFLPSEGKGHILFTTRAQMLGTLAHGIEIEKMEPEEGALFLLRRTKILALDASLENASTADRTKAREIVEAVDGLPLALDQAGAYIEETGCGLAGYLERFKTQQSQLLKRRGGLAHDHPESVATTWTLSFEKVEQANPAAADLLRLCAFLAPDAIPEEIITESAPDLTSALQAVASNAIELDVAVGELRRYSLVRRDPVTQTLTIHRLVQAALKDAMEELAQRHWAERTVRAVNRAFPDATDYRNWPLCQQYLPHAWTCATLIDAWEFAFPEAGSLLNKAGYYLDDRALYEEAEPLLQRAITIGEKTLGPEHPDLAIYLNNLAQLYQNQGKYAQAEPLFRRALAISEKALGPEHSFTAAILNNLAQLYQDQGKYVQVEPLFRRALAISERVLGPNHPEIATTLNNLAGLYRVQGDYGKAESLLKQALAIWEQALGPEHSETAMTLNSLAGLYQDHGQYAQAEPLYQRALTIWEQVVKSDDPGTAAALNNLAQLYQDQGKYAQAEPLFRRALAIREQVLGAEHPETAITLHNLALLDQNQGQYEQAAALYRRALVAYEKAFSPDHPSTATSLNNLAGLYRTQGRYEQAEQFYRRALAIYEKILGPNHPDTAATLNNLGVLYRIQRKYEQAEPLLRQALSIREQSLGSEHPDTLIAFVNLAKLYAEQGKYEQADHLLQQALTIGERVLEHGHPLIAQNLNLLARISYEQGNFELAESLWEQSLSILEKTLGVEHPAIAERLNDLAELYFAQGRYTQAQSFCQRALGICEKMLGSEHPDTITIREHLTRIVSKIEAEQDDDHHSAPPSG